MSTNDIIFFAGIDWDNGNKMPCHHVVERLARRHRVFYIDNFGGIRDLTWSDARRALRKLRSIVSHKEHKEESSAEAPMLQDSSCQEQKTANQQLPTGNRQPEPPVIDRPMIIPIPRTRVLQVCNGWLLNRRLKRLIRNHRIEKPIIWTRLPIELVWRAIEGVDRSLLLYQMIDKFPEHPKIARGLRERHGRWERWFSENADVVFASARGLWEEKKAVNPRSCFFPNGASGIFRMAGVPEESLERRAPVVGFAGAIGTSLDLEWVSEVARARPRYRFVFLGTIDPEIDLSGLRSLPNVSLEGRVPHDRLPEWFGMFDAALMAYRYNDYQKYTFPSKMAEYLLAGLPVVSNRIPEVEPYGEVVHVVDTPDEMASALDRAVRERTDPVLLERRRSLGESLSWDRIVEGMEEVIEERMREGR